MRPCLLVMLLLLGMMTMSCADDHNVIGWHWYNVPDETALEAKLPKPIPPIVPSVESLPIAPKHKPKTALEKLKAFQAHYEEVKAEWTINPTVENSAKLMRMNAYMTNMSHKAALAGQQALLKYPELSNRLKHPTDTVGRQAHIDQLNQKEEQAVKALAKKFGLFYFYYGKDPMAQALSPSIQQFAERYGIELIGVTMDGTVHEVIKHNRANDGQAKNFEVKAFPALILVNPQKAQFQPIAYGFIAHGELLNRFLKIATHYEINP